MKVVSATFVKSAMRPEEYPRNGRPEVAFAGRSNVGKSSLLNTLLNRKGLAKTSKTPGKTRAVNFFDVNGKIYFVDLPGYGFAKVSKAMQAAWQDVITSYLVGRAPLKLAVHLIDSRHPPTPRDHDLLELLDRAKSPTIIVATKVDKLKRNQRDRLEKIFRAELDLDDDVLIIPFSSVTGEGKLPLWNVIDEQIRK